MAFYTFQLSHVLAKSTRSRGNQDINLFTFGVLVNNREQGRASALAPIWENIPLDGGTLITEAARVNGMATDFVNSKTNWTIGPIQVGEDDIVDVVYTATNTSDSQISSVDQRKFDEWSIKFLNVYYSWLLGQFVSAFGLKTIADYVGKGASSVSSFFKDPVANILGYAPQGPCNGPVYSGRLQYRGRDLNALDWQPEDGYDTIVISNSYSDAETHDVATCGPVALTDISITGSRSGQWSWRRFYSTQLSMRAILAQERSLRGSVLVSG